ncbi:MAG: hypothetical protein GX444_00030 [Myxococcales bacterium]|nr:hypothetical protein [Myxococcales bacterium]
MGKGLCGLLLVLLAAWPAFAAEESASPAAVPEAFPYVPPSDRLPPGIDAEPEAVAVTDEPPVWYRWRPPADFGPGSYRRGGVRLLSVKTPRFRIELQAGMQEFTRNPDKLIAEAQGSFNYPIVPLGAELLLREKDDGLGVLLWASSLLQWYRIVYVTVFFD